MNNEAKFLDGFRVYTPSEKAPDFIVANFEIDGDSFAGRGKVRGVLKRSKGGKLYAVEDDYKPEGQRQQSQPKPTQKSDNGSLYGGNPDSYGGGGFDDDKIPFAPLGKRKHWVA